MPYSQKLLDLCLPASWHSTLPVDVTTDLMVIGFQPVAGGEPVRLLIPIESARLVVASIQEYLDSYDQRGMTRTAMTVHQDEFSNDRVGPSSFYTEILTHLQDAGFRAV